MVIANRILSDRRKRLSTHGISWKEIFENEFYEYIEKLSSEDISIYKVSDDNTGNNRKTINSHIKKGSCDELSFFRQLEVNHGAEEIEIARKYMEWSYKNRLKNIWGGRKKICSFDPLLEHEGIDYTPIKLHTSKEGLMINLRALKKILPFDKQEKFKELFVRLSEIYNLNLPPGGNPRVKWPELIDKLVLTHLFDTLDKVIHEIRQER
jgi:hypothetical protein